MIEVPTKLFTSTAICSATACVASRLQNFTQPENFGIMHNSVHQTQCSRSLSGVEAPLPTSPHQFWNALLHLQNSLSPKWKLSQSPSILECSPTSTTKRRWNTCTVAVPINSGMLSYNQKNVKKFDPLSRSPHQFWNALLL